MTRGIPIYLATPRLRGLLAVSFATAAAGAFVLVNTVVLVRAGYGGGEGAVAVALGLGPELALPGPLAGAAAIPAARLWPADYPGAVAHDHAELPPDHPHLRAHGSGASHVHRLVIDDLHPAWPGRA